MPGPFLNTGVFQTQVTANDADQKEEVGAWRFESGKVFRYVRAGALIPKGEAVRYDTSVAAGSPGLLGNQVLQTSGPTDVCFGVAESTLALGNYGWITAYGPGTARVASNQVPGAGLGPDTLTGVLQIRGMTHYNMAALAVQTGLSAGSAVFVLAL